MPAYCWIVQISSGCKWLIINLNVLEMALCSVNNNVLRIDIEKSLWIHTILINYDKNCHYFLLKYTIDSILSKF